MVTFFLISLSIVSFLSLLAFGFFFWSWRIQCDINKQLFKDSNEMESSLKHELQTQRDINSIIKDNEEEMEKYLDKIKAENSLERRNLLARIDHQEKKIKDLENFADEAEEREEVNEENFNTYSIMGITDLLRRVEKRKGYRFPFMTIGPNNIIVGLKSVREGIEQNVMKEYSTKTEFNNFCNSVDYFESLLEKERESVEIQEKQESNGKNLN